MATDTLKRPGPVLPLGGQRLKTVMGGDPEAPMAPPNPEAFEPDGIKADYLTADSLKLLGSKLIEVMPGLTELRYISAEYFWKRSGGAVDGRPKLGGIVRHNGLQRHLTELDFVFWLAADHLALANAGQIEAALYHILLHAGVRMDGRTTLRHPDIVAFTLELEEFGDWRKTLHMPDTQAEMDLDDDE